MIFMLLYGILGLGVGVLLNWLIDRLPEGGDIRPFSRCSTCRTRPVGWDWVPVVGYALGRGHCPSCGTSLPVRTPLVELSTGLIFAFLWGFLGPSGLLVLYTVYFGILGIIFVIDLEHRLILNRLIWPAIAFALLAVPLRPWLARPSFASYGATAPLLAGQGEMPSLWAAGMLNLLLGGIVGLAVFAIMWLIAPQGLGAGDVKLALFAGLVTGMPGVVWVIVGSFLLAGIIAVVLLLSRRVGLKSAIPFAPFMVLATMVVLLYGNKLLQWTFGI
jgi:leader peptidase (prepilin peptidase)/N-methyltransferase